MKVALKEIMEGFPKDLIELMDELTAVEFFKLSLYKLTKIKIETDAELENLGKIIDKATDVYEEHKLNSLHPNLKAEFLKVISERGWDRYRIADKKKETEKSAEQHPELFESESNQSQLMQQSSKQKEASPIHRRQYRNRSRSPPSAYRARSRSRPRSSYEANKYDSPYSPEKKNIGTPRRGEEDDYGSSSRKSSSYRRVRSSSRSRTVYESQSKYDEKKPSATPRRNEETDILLSSKSYSTLSKKTGGSYLEFY